MHCHLAFADSTSGHFAVWSYIVTTLKTVAESAAQLGREARESVEEAGRSAERKFDEAREETGAALHTAASTVRSTGRRGSEAITDLATGTAEHLDATGSYIEDYDLRRVLAGVRSFGRRHLAGSLLTAAAVGFFAGSAIRRATHKCRQATDTAQA
jgi:ElaB/YqjD/DUF883 family membrane-anchored ribosome-binding protein